MFTKLVPNFRRDLDSMVVIHMEMCLSDPLTGSNGFLSGEYPVQAIGTL